TLGGVTAACGPPALICATSLRTAAFDTLVVPAVVSAEVLPVASVGVPAWATPAVPANKPTAAAAITAKPASLRLIVRALNAVSFVWRPSSVGAGMWPRLSSCPRTLGGRPWVNFQQTCNRLVNPAVSGRSPRRHRR